MKIGIKLLLIFIFGSFLIYGQAKMSLQVGMQFPEGNFAQVAHNGLGGIAVIIFPQDQSLSLSASLGYNYWGPYTAWYLGPSDSYSSLLALIGLRYAFSNYNAHPYLGLEIGMNSLDYSRTTSYGITSSIYDVSEARFCIAPSFGVIAKINTSMSFDINIKYNVSSDEQINGITLPATFFSLNDGIQFDLY